MPNLYGPDMQKPITGSAPYGQGYNESYAYQKAGTLNADKIYFGVIPAGVEVQLASLVTDAAGASTTLSLGYEAVDPSLPGAPAANLTYWLNAQATSAAGRFNSAAHPIRFSRDVFLVGTVGGANHSAAPKQSVAVIGSQNGAP